MLSENAVFFGSEWRYLDCTSTHVSTTYDYDPKVTTSECNDPKTFRPRDPKSQKWTDYPSNENCDTATQKVGSSVTDEHYEYDPLVFLVSIVGDRCVPDFTKLLSLFLHGCWALGVF